MDQRSTITLGTIERLAGSTTAENLGVNLQESKQIANRLQDTVVKQQLHEHCEQRRKCLTCGKQRPVKDFRCRRLDTVLGTVRLRVPRYRRCQCRSGTQVWSPISEVLSGRVTPELRQSQAQAQTQSQIFSRVRINSNGTAGSSGKRSVRGTETPVKA